MAEHNAPRTETADDVEPNPDANELDRIDESSAAPQRGSEQDDGMLDPPQRRAGGLVVKIIVVVALVALMIAGLVGPMRLLFWIALVMFFCYGVLLLLPVMLAGGTKAADRGR